MATVVATTKTEMNDSFVQARENFLNSYGSGWMKHVHPNDRNEVIGYLMRMLASAEALPGTKFQVWNSVIPNRPKGYEKIGGFVKVLVKCVGSDRSYFYEVPYSAN